MVHAKGAKESAKGAKDDSDVEPLQGSGYISRFNPRLKPGVIYR